MDLSVAQLYNECLGNGIRVWPVYFKHIELIETLPYHHKDPFDRILIAQSIAEDLVVLTADRTFARYDVTLL